MEFENAVSLIKENADKFMRLDRWSHEVKIKIQYPNDISKMTAPYFYVESRFGMVPWIPTMIEMFSDQWEVYSSTK